jgi:2-oxoglutarate ferredoxin oxidoreductase subunit alpha
MSKTYALTGNQVVARAALDAGCRFYAGYPISPSSEIAAEMAKALPRLGGAFIQMEDEIASMAAIIGASLTGKKVMTATSGPGFSLKQENLGFACMTEIPCVVVNVMRSGPSTGMPTFPAQGDVMQARWGTHGDHPIIVLVPSFHHEIYAETIRAFNLAETYRQPVILLTDEVLSQMSERVDIPDPAMLTIINRQPPPADKIGYKPYENTTLVPPLASFFQGYRFHVTGLTHDETGFPTENTTIAETLMTRLRHKLTHNLEDILKWETLAVEDAEVLLISFGSAGRSAQQAVLEARERHGVKVGLFRPLTLWPFPEAALRQAAQGKSRVMVAEMNEGQLALEVERVLHQPVETVLRPNGVMITPDEIMAALLQQVAPCGVG